MPSTSPLHILLTGRFDADEREAWRQALAQAMPDAAWHLDAGGANASLIEVAVVADPAPGVLAALPRLRFVQSLWAGVERLLADPSVQANVPIARMVDPAMSAAMAETALWACLSLHRGFFGYARQQASGLWRQRPQQRADEIAIAVLGLGRMGGTVARRLAGQRYAVTGWALHDRSPAGVGHVAAVDARGFIEPSEQAVAFATCTGADALPALLARSDIVVNLLPLTPATRGLLDHAFFAAMKPGAAVVNLARGAHVVDADLLAALDTGQVGHAVLDVFTTEPLPPDHRYWAHPHVTLLPHAAAMTDLRTAAALAVDNILAWRDACPIANLADRSRGY